MSKDKIIHYCDWGAQGDLHYLCGKWSEAAWGRTTQEILKEKETNVFSDDYEECYSFVFELATCDKCIEAKNK